MTGQNDISDDELLRDIELTEKELDAYEKIADGFMTLSLLPENGNVAEGAHRWQYNKYMTWAKECSEFLNKLYALKKGRGL